MDQDNAQERQAGRQCEPVIARIAQPRDLPALLRLAEETDVGSIRADPERIAREVEICHQTLAGEAPWEQGMLFLVTDCHRPGVAPALVGQAKIRWAFDACWLKITRVREWRGETTAHDVLVYHSEPSGALEFAGNAVLRRFQSQGIGSFHTKARILFLLLFDPPGVNQIFADFLTMEVRGRYPFYEEIVRPLLGDRDYDEMDALRSEARGRRVELFDSHLGPTDDQHACEILLHALPPAIRDAFGLVRPESRAAAKALQRYGFTPCDKYDLLDAGQYMETSIASLRATHRTETLSVEKAPRSDPADNTETLVFAPRRGMAEFIAIRSAAIAAGHELLIDPQLFRALNLTAGEPVEVLR